MPAEFVSVKGSTYMGDPNTDIDLSINTAHIMYVTFRHTKDTHWDSAIIELVDGSLLSVSDQDSVHTLREHLGA